MASPLISLYTLPGPDVHPRIFMRDLGQGTSEFLFPTVATVRARTTGSHVNEYTALLNYADSHLGDSETFFIGGPTTYSGRRDPEFSGMYAFIARMMNFTGTSPTGHLASEYLLQAIDIADGLINARSTVEAQSGDTRKKIEREHGVAAAQIYDWAFEELGSARQNALYQLIKAYASHLSVPSDTEFLWGTVHGHACYALQMLIAILNDGTSAENTSTKANLDQLLEMFDPGVAPPGTKQLGYWPVFRHFGAADGGTHKGSGPGGYDTIQQEFYGRLMTGIRTALQMPCINTETWFRLASDWKLWNWRCDRTFYRQHDMDQIEAYSHFTQANAYISACLGQNASEKNRWRWLAQEIESSQSGHMDRAYNLWKVVWDPKDPASPTVPTIADVNGGNVMKFFKEAGLTVWREGWATTDLSFRMSSEPFFTGTHQRRVNGAVQWAHNGAAMCVQSGGYDKDQDQTYKALDSGGTVIQGIESGHYNTYAKRIMAQSVCRIYSSSEPGSNMQHSFQRFGATTSRFGRRLGSSSVTVTNDGGQLWPKNIGGTGQFFYQPGGLGDIVGEFAISAWVYNPAPYPLPNRNPIENSAFAYQVTDLKGSYWSGKCSRYRRHVLWIKNGQIPSWPRPIIMIWDDVVANAIDGTAGNQTIVQQWQLLANPTEVGPLITITRTGAGAYAQAPTRDARTFINVLSPTGFSSGTFEGYRDVLTQSGQFYPHTDIDTLCDTGQNSNGTGGVWRKEIHASPSTTTPNFLVLICPRASSATFTLATSLLFDAEKIGATINGVNCTIRRDTDYGATVGAISGGGGAPDPEPPPAITDLFGTAGDARVDLQWGDTPDPTATKYRIYRSNKVAGVYNAFAQLAEIVGAPPSPSEYADTTAANGTTYKYKVTVFNAVGESADSNLAQDLTPFAPPPATTGNTAWKTARFTPRYRDTQQ